MQISINWTDPINWLIALALLILLTGQFWLIAHNQSLSSNRKSLRTGLNLLLWLLVVGYLLQLHWPVQRSPTHALLVGDDVPATFYRQIKDSLHIQDSFTSQNLKDDYDSVTLAGQQFPTETLTKLSNSSVQWVPYSKPDQLQDIHWKGVVRQGEIQRVTGRIQSSEKQLLRLRFGSQTLDSVALNKGDNTFALQFPAFSRGRSQCELVLGGTTPLDTIRFFSRLTEPLSVQILLNNPDFESKTLADWLGKQGHTVQVTTTLSKNINSNVSINKVGKSARKTTPDLIITEPTNAASVTVKKAIAEGKSVLFINITNPETDSRAINQALGSQWQVRKISNEPVILVGNGLNALPYRFRDNLNQLSVSGYPVAVQQTTQNGFAGRVGISLLQETFPLSLSGDSVAYNRIWTAVLARLSHSDKGSIQVNAPVYSGLQQEISVNNSGSSSPFMLVGQDTVSVARSPINERSAMGSSLFGHAGWQSVQDSLAIYVNAHNSTDAVANRQLISQFMLARSLDQLGTKPLTRTITAQLPNWAWLLLIVACLTALWVEPKWL